MIQRMTPEIAADIATLDAPEALRRLADMITVSRWYTLEEIHGDTVLMVGGKHGEPVDIPGWVAERDALAARAGLVWAKP